MTIFTKGMGKVGSWFKTRGRNIESKKSPFKNPPYKARKRNIESAKMFEKARARSKEKAKEVDLKKIHDKFFDKSGMKKKGKDIVKEGLKDLK